MTECPAPDHSRFHRWLLVATAVAAGLLLVTVYLSQHAHFYVSQRESQTAITAYYLVHEDHSLFSYITPVMGYPWAIPMELPVQQQLAAWLSWLVPLDDAGRLVSLVCFILCLVVAYRLSLLLEVSQERSLAVVTLLLSSPIYLCYSLSFTIESTALLCSLLYLYLFVRFEKRFSYPILALSLAFGVLAALAKATTWVVFAAIIGLLLLHQLNHGLRQRRLELRVLLVRAGLLLVPLSAGLLWAGHGDRLKAQNPIANAITSQSLAAWNYGTISQKLSLADWGHFWLRTGVTLLGVAGAVLPLLLVVKLLRQRRWPPRSALIGICLLATVTGPMIFTNLHFVHDYYCMAGGLFLIFALVIALRETLGRALLVVVVVSNLMTAGVYLKLKQLNYDDPVNRHIVEAVKGLPAECTIIVYGAFFDSFIPYYAGNKALQTEQNDYSDPAVQQALANIEDHNVAVVIAKGSRYQPIAARTARRLGCDSSFKLSDEVTIHYRPDRRDQLQLSRVEVAEIADARIEAFLDQFNRSGSRVVLTLGRDGSFALLYYAGGNLYLLDSVNGAQILHRQRLVLPHQTISLTIESTEKTDPTLEP
jgi:hypothetical protein